LIISSPPLRKRLKRTTSEEDLAVLIAKRKEERVRWKCYVIKFKSKRQQLKAPSLPSLNLATGSESESEEAAPPSRPAPPPAPQAPPAPPTPEILIISSPPLRGRLKRTRSEEDLAVLIAKRKEERERQGRVPAF